MSDQVKHPSHYRTAGGLEAIDVLEAFDLVSNHYRATAICYLLRAGRKSDELADLKKSQRYIAREIWILEGRPGADPWKG